MFFSDIQENTAELFKDKTFSLINVSFYFYNIYSNVKGKHKVILNTPLRIRRLGRPFCRARGGPSRAAPPPAPSRGPELKDK